MKQPPPLLVRVIFRKVQPRELSKVSAGSFIVGTRSGFGRWVYPKVDFFSLDLNGGVPVIPPYIQTSTTIARRAQGHGAIGHVLRPRSRSQIATPIIQSVSVFVVNEGGVIDTENESVKLHAFPALRLVRVGVFGVSRLSSPLQAPRKRAHPFHVFRVDQGEPSHLQRNQERTGHVWIRDNFTRRSLAIDGAEPASPSAERLTAPLACFGPRWIATRHRTKLGTPSPDRRSASLARNRRGRLWGHLGGPFAEMTRPWSLTARRGFRCTDYTKSREIYPESYGYYGEVVALAVATERIAGEK